jgi:Kef-type K+ transport system membrane component KefB
MLSFTSLLIIGVVAVLMPLLLGFIPSVKLPPVVLEILGGVLVGPTVLGWVHQDAPVRVIADLGLGFLLFMAGFEIDLRRFSSRVLALAGRAFGLSVALALLAGYLLQVSGQINDGLLAGITLMATSLGILVPILKDAENTESPFGQLIMAGGSMAELGPLVLVSLFFSASSKNPGPELGLLAAFIALTAGVVVAAARLRRWARIRQVVERLANTSSQLRVRLVMTFALAFGVVAEHFGLATILGSFLAGIIVRRTAVAPASYDMLKGKLEAIGFGFLIPVFFVSTGVGLNIKALFASTRAEILVPVFLITLLLVRGLPALLYVRVLGRGPAVAAGFLQATSLSFIVVATIVGVDTGHLRASTASAIVVAGLLSVIIYPQVAMLLLKNSPDPSTVPLAEPPSAAPPAEPTGPAEGAAVTGRDEAT